MRIRTDKITRQHITRAVAAIPGGGVTLLDDTLPVHGSTTHRRAFDVALRGHGSRHTRYPNNGKRGGGRSDDGMAATYDDWGWFLAFLFDVDRSMVAGPYKSRSDFHVQTNNAYMWADDAALAAGTEN